MGRVPLPPPARNAAQALAWYGGGWQRQLRHRRSWWPWRRRSAYEACLALIRAREAVLGMAPDPWAAHAPAPPARLAVVGEPGSRPRDPRKPTTA